MGKEYFSADFHFDHALMVEKRGFASIDDMNESIIDSVNSACLPGDILYFVGDWSLGKDPARLLDRIAPRIVFIRGNHDTAHYFQDTIMEWHPWALKRKICGVNMLLSHYPWESWPGRAMIHGHWHKRGMPEKCNRVNVCYDLWGRPVRASEIKQMLTSF